MQQANLKEYLKAVVDTEKDLYLKCKMQEFYSRQISSLGKSKINSMPEKKEPQLAKSSNETGWLAPFLLILPIVSWIISGSFLVGVITFIVFSAICVFIDKQLTEKSNQKIVASAEEEYSALMRDYQKQLAEDTARVGREIAVKKYLESELSTLQKYTDKTSDTLRQLYNANLIYPKYRNLSMVSSIYEYISSGRCASLGDAYNILENEIRLDKIITQLDDVITNLKTLQQSQYVLYRAIIETNEKLERMNKSIDQISSNIEEYCSHNPKTDIESYLIELEKHSEASAYFTERVQIELSYLNRMNYLTGKNDGISNNLPPSF